MTETDDIGPPGDSSSTQAPLIKESGIDRLRLQSLHIAHGTLGTDPTIIFAHDSVCPFNVTHLRTYQIHAESADGWIRHQEFISHVSHSLETLEIDFSNIEAQSFGDGVLPPLDCCQLDNLKQLHVQTSYTVDRFALQSCVSLLRLFPVNINCKLSLYGALSAQNV
ncbi:hypothetical protein M378DRAFT_729876 [Amanita muscaria Koide BX008]|uniref:Uncharacterized protein n=1 Tax=Amanita muscaria (strain Koide BX008) TaxID=946122 RepID=A0A0C2X1Z2_AMAMK|nr:hypothetical protein M378DRAFT_729876 [Amanita muscaria Koide BX008]